MANFIQPVVGTPVVTGLYSNAIINGDMNISQRGTSFVSIGDSIYTLDRWIHFLTGLMRTTVTQDTDVPSGESFTNSLKFDCTTIDASIDAGDYLGIGQKIEGYNFSPYINKTATLSFWVKSTKTGIYCVSFRNNAADRSYIAEYTINVSDTWEKKTITLDFDSDGTWETTNSAGVGIIFLLAAGTTYQSTADSWQTGNYMATANQVNWCDSTDNNFWITGVQLNIGSNANDFEYIDYSTSLARCQRYYEANSFFLGSLAANGGYATYNYMVEKRTPTPTITVNSDTWFTGGAAGTVSAGKVSSRYLIITNASNLHLGCQLIIGAEL